MKRKQRADKGRNPKKTTLIVAGIAITVVAIGIVIILVNNNSQPNNLTGPKTTTAQSSLSFSSLAAGGSPVKGSTSAKVTLIEFGDFQCHYCDRFTKDTEPQIVQQYIDTGKINIVFKHFAWYGPDSISAAMASQCANDQGKFWQYHDILYQNQGEINSGWASKDNLKKFALQIGLDSEKFNSCLDSEKYKSLVQSDINLASSVGFQGTPGFIIEKSDGTNQQQIAGAFPFATFQQTLDKEIAQS